MSLHQLSLRQACTTSAGFCCSVDVRRRFAAAYRSEEELQDAANRKASVCAGISALFPACKLDRNVFLDTIQCMIQHDASTPPSQWRCQYVVKT